MNDDLVELKLVTIKVKIKVSFAKMLKGVKDLTISLGIVEVKTGPELSKHYFAEE